MADCQAAMQLTILQSLNRTCAHRQLLAEAAAAFQGTSEEVRVALADCEAAIARGDAESALRRLQVSKITFHFTGNYCCCWGRRPGMNGTVLQISICCRHRAL